MKDSHDVVVAGFGVVVAALLLVAGELYLDYAQKPTIPDRYAASVGGVRGRPSSCTSRLSCLSSADMHSHRF